MTLDWLINPYTPIALAALLAACITGLRIKKDIDENEDSLLFSNLVSLGTLFLAILLIIIAIAATQATSNVCKSSTNTTNTLSNNGCGFLNSAINLYGSYEVLLLGVFFLIVIFCRALLYSHYDRKSYYTKWIIGMLVWTLIIWIIFAGIFTILSLTLYINSLFKAANSTITTIVTTIPSTINTTTIANVNKSVYCNTQPAFVHIGNSIVCGSFTATILNATNTSVSLRATYYGLSINKTVTNQKGYIGDTFALNFSGTVVYARVWGFFSSNQKVYFQMSTAPIVLTTTITLPTTSSTTVPSITTTI